MFFISGFVAGYLASIAFSYLWTRYHYNKRQKLISEIMRSYDSKVAAANYFLDQQEREQNGERSTIH